MSRLANGDLRPRLPVARRRFSDLRLPSGRPGRKSRDMAGAGGSVLSDGTSQIAVGEAASSDLPGRHPERVSQLGAQDCTKRHNAVRPHLLSPSATGHDYAARWVDARIRLSRSAIGGDARTGGLLVALVLRPSRTHRAVYLPAGLWYNLHERTVRGSLRDSSQVVKMSRSGQLRATRPR